MKLRQTPGTDRSKLMQTLLDNPRRPKKGKGKDLKQQYRMTIMLGMIFSLSTLTLVMRADLYAGGDEQSFDLSVQETVQIEEIKQTEQAQKPPPPPRPPVPVSVSDDVLFDDVELDLDAFLDLDAEILDIPPPPPTPAMADEDEEEEIFVVVEQMPEIIGGNQKVYEHLEYPEIARQAGIEGLVVVQIVVGPDGLPYDPVTVRTGGQVLDEAAVMAVMALKFIPGKQRSKAVPVRLAIPIRFRLKDIKQ